MYILPILSLPLAAIFDKMIKFIVFVVNIPLKGININIAKLRWRTNIKMSKKYYNFNLK